MEQIGLKSKTIYQIEHWLKSDLMHKSFLLELVNRKNKFTLLKPIKLRINKSKID